MYASEVFTLSDLTVGQQKRICGNGYGFSIVPIPGTGAVYPVDVHMKMSDNGQSVGPILVTGNDWYECPAGFDNLQSYALRTSSKGSYYVTRGLVRGAAIRPIAPAPGFVAPPLLFSPAGSQSDTTVSGATGGNTAVITVGPGGAGTQTSGTVGDYTVNRPTAATDGISLIGVKSFYVELQSVGNTFDTGGKIGFYKQLPGDTTWRFLDNVEYVIQHSATSYSGNSSLLFAEEIVNIQGGRIYACLAGTVSAGTSGQAVTVKMITTS